jgi:hypothetical protein
VLGLLYGFVLLLLCVGVHYEGLRLCSRFVAVLHVRRLAVAFSIVGASVAHMIEILVFAVGMRVLAALGWGEIEPMHEGFGDLIYFSAVTYTSLGFGDVVPTGAMREVSGLAALTGLVMIAWTASFSFVQMDHFWRDR